MQFSSAKAFEQKKVKTKGVHKNLVEARKALDFNQDQLTEVYWGGKETMAEWIKLRDNFAKDPILKNDPSYFDLEREELMEEGYKKLNRIYKTKIMDIDYKNVAIAGLLLNNGGVSTSLHSLMFEASVRYLADDDQVREWLPKILKLQMIGNYCQTELGHGSNVKGLQTTATLDKETDQWVIHSPTIQSTKWWPGDMGTLGTHSAVYAQTIVDGKNHGTNCFMVQIRDMDSHRPVPGIEVGDIGPKFGFQAKDNGYAIFTNLRIPRTNILKRYLNVTQEGKVKRLGNPLVLYSIMMFTRLQVMSTAQHLLAKGICIATRYALVRTQFNTAKDGEATVERKLLDYQTHQHRIVENLANVYIMSMSMTQLYKTYEKMIARIQKKNDFSLMAPMHTVLAGLKALYCAMGYEGIKTMRECCGAAGFSKLSSFGSLIDVTSALVTLEGDSVVMNLQTARALLKSGKQVVVKGKKLPGNLEYINDLPILMKDAKSIRVTASSTDQDYFHNVKNLGNLLKWNALMSIGRALRLFSDPKYNQYNDWEKFYQKFQLDLIRMATDHSYYMAYTQSMYAISKLDVQTDKTVIGHLTRLLRIFCLNIIIKHSTFLTLTQHITHEHLRTAESALNSEVSAIRPQMLNLIESAAFDDNSLASAIGCEDGQAIERLFNQASQSRLNGSDKIKGFEQYMQPIIQSDWKTLKARL